MNTNNVAPIMVEQTNDFKILEFKNPFNDVFSLYASIIHKLWN